MYINRPYRLASHSAYTGGRGGVMVKCIAFSYGTCLLMLYLPSGAKQTSIHGPTYSKLSDIRGLICEKFNFRKLGVSATEIAILKEN